MATRQGSEEPGRSDRTGALAANLSCLARLFQCPICFDYALPPIVQCPNGHIVCSSCRSKLTCCPTCRGPLGSTRNRAMEELASDVPFPCTYASNGCQSALSCTEKPGREDSCDFRSFGCPYPGEVCTWHGPCHQVVQHLSLCHPSITTLQGEDVVFHMRDIHFPGVVVFVVLQSCHGHHFLLVLEKQDKCGEQQQFHAVVQILGTPRQAEQFVCRLELSGRRRRLMWEAPARSILRGVQSAIVEHDCLLFDAATARLFVDDGTLSVNMAVSQG